MSFIPLFKFLLNEEMFNGTLGYAEKELCLPLCIPESKYFAASQNLLVGGNYPLVFISVLETMVTNAAKKNKLFYSPEGLTVLMQSLISPENQMAFCVLIIKALENKVAVGR
ncbi:hypothetical protein EK904_010426 [Melospiza melodia maxima]|nr:hypothetical protein EK904_010426 [Melospiza melodia maxima]